MTVDWDKMFDTYSRHARVYPALLVLLPFLFTAIAWFPSIVASNIVDAALSLAVTCGLLYMLASFSRTMGKRHEKRLLAVWGGWPTALWLRHADANLPVQTKTRYHAFFTQHVPGLNLPTAEAEALDLAAAHGAYDSAVGWLKEQCRSKEFELVHRENAQYGFRRNMRGLRSIGILISIGSIMFSLVYIAVIAYFVEAATPFSEIARTTPPLVGIAGAFSLLALIAWVFLVRDAWVREAGDQYARALLANCDTLNMGSNAG